MNKALIRLSLLLFTCLLCRSLYLESGIVTTLLILVLSFAVFILIGRVKQLGDEMKRLGAARTVTDADIQHHARSFLQNELAPAVKQKQRPTLH
jgi:hypothetical protein